MAFVAEASCVVLVGHEIYRVLVPRPWAGSVAVERPVESCPYSPPQPPRSRQWLLRSPLSANLCPTWRSAGSKTHTVESCFLKNTTAYDQLSRTFPRSVRVCVLSCSVMADSLRPRGLWPARLLCLWNFPGKLPLFSRELKLHESHLVEK